MPETDLYLPVKRLLERQGYVVKAEVRGCDVVGVRGTEPLVIVELKIAMSLQLLLQAVDRLTLTDHVYIAVARPKRGITGEMLKLCRRIGIGLIVVTKSGSLEVLADPVPYAPRKNDRQRALLLREFMARTGDPNVGGSAASPIMTAYKQDAIKCRAHLHLNGPSRALDVKQATGIDRAANIMRDNHHGWFQRTDRGIYALSEAGSAVCVTEASTTSTKHNSSTRDSHSAPHQSRISTSCPRPDRDQRSGDSAGTHER